MSAFRRLAWFAIGLALAAGTGVVRSAEVEDDASLSQESDTKAWWKEVDWSLPGLATDWHVHRKDGLRIDATDGRLKLKLNANLWADAGNVGTDDAVEGAFPGMGGSTALFSRARATLRGWLYDVGDFKFQVEFAQDPQVKDSWFRFRPLPYVGRIRVGNMREPFSLENSTSGNNLSFLSRALPTLALAPGRNIGVAAQDTALDGRITWSAGWFWNTASYANFGGAKDALSESIGEDLVARVTGLPRYADHGRELVHLGLSVARNRYFDRIRSRAVPETALTDDPLVDTGKFQADRSFQVAAELALVRGPWSFQAEYFDSAMKLADAGTVRLKGFYAFVSHVLTGESRRYDRGTGVFDGVHPSRAFAFGSDGWGAWEAVLRLSHVDLNDGPLSGGRQTDLTAGLNWYIDDRSRLMLNYVYGVVKDRNNAPAIERGRVGILQARFAVAF